jgi:hypothetical protein
MNGIDNGPAGAGGGANVGIGSGSGLIPTAWARNGGHRHNSCAALPPDKTRRYRTWHIRFAVEPRMALVLLVYQINCTFSRKAVGKS